MFSRARSLTVYSRRDNKEERQVLGNLLRSQTRSVKVLRDIENKQERKPRASRASRSKKPPGLDYGPKATTAEVLLDAIPPLPGRENLSTYPRLNTYTPLNSNNADSGANIVREALQQNSHFDLTQGSPFDHERSAGSLYPPWRNRAPEYVEMLVRQWTQPSHEPIQTVRDSATTQKDSNFPVMLSIRWRRKKSRMKPQLLKSSKMKQELPEPRLKIVFRKSKIGLRKGSMAGLKSTIKRSHG